MIYCIINFFYSDCHRVFKLIFFQLRQREKSICHFISRYFLYTFISFFLLVHQFLVTSIFWKHFEHWCCSIFNSFSPFFQYMLVLINFNSSKILCISSSGSNLKNQQQWFNFINKLSIWKFYACMKYIYASLIIWTARTSHWFDNSSICISLKRVFFNVLW